MSNIVNHNARVEPLLNSGLTRYVSWHPKHIRPVDITRVATWNVEGLGANTTKLEQIIQVMRYYNIAVLCIQETHVTAAPVYDIDGFLVILSGGIEGTIEYAGVGFIVAPWARLSIMCFVQYNSRLASLRMRVPGGNITLICAYAPQSKISYDVRQNFFTDLQEVTSMAKCHGPMYCVGDFNARFHGSPQVDKGVLGAYTWGAQRKRLVHAVMRLYCLNTL